MPENPIVGIARRELRTGRWCLAVATVAAVAAVVFAYFAFARPHTIWHGLLVIAITMCGTCAIQGIRMTRNGRATLRDELRRQAEAGSSGSAVDRERE